MERSFRNQSDYTIQAARSFVSGDIATAITASDLADEESRKFNELAEHFNKIYHSK
ncbi:hypothetical protein G5B30_16435 [Sphingobacterium sp. SGG-5]|uniref:hypothetical protein n=1 Tax=Sphingobacterium sp. SGG-5 TaxID=2710881 RepID=UPI0013EA6B29|nr:hypothetical protein [Sphingobacterium sp. SGG-5]NGM63498.1 hypothetical protein [Sphingobacterium sp. SGG-5]